MLYYLPIEPLTERYTSQWYSWFTEEFDQQGVPWVTIDGVPLTDRVEVGTFLDINSTISFKSMQLAEIAARFHSRSITDEDVIFLPDCEMFGLEGAIKYLARLNNVRCKIYGFAHAGSYTREDFVEPCSPWACKYESAWGQIFDTIFVGTEYHKEQLCRSRTVPPYKVRVTGNPYRVAEVRASIDHQPKEDLIVHTNRPDPEKRPHDTLDVFEALHEREPDWKFAVTTSRRWWAGGELRERAERLRAQGWFEIYENLTKEEYFRLLQRAKVMTGNTIEENFGYCLLEAMIFDTIPVVAGNYSHPELVGGDPRCLFRSFQEQLDCIDMAMTSPFEVYQYAKKYERSLPTIVQHMRDR